MHIYYYLGKETRDPVMLEIKDPDGKTVSEIEGLREKGIHRLVWDTREAEPGIYRISLRSGKREITKSGLVKERLLFPAGNKAHDFK